jgi:ABC-type multidrug transport system ATPase subunit
LAEPRYALWAEGVRKSFGGTEALKAGALWAEPGRVTTLLGRNGSGKTTLMRIAAGVLRADQGVVAMAGNTGERHTLARLSGLGLMYLGDDRLGVPAYRVRSLFYSIERVYGTGRTGFAVESMQLGGLLDQRVGSLSPGERVRTAMGVAIARRPVVLIADEPLAGLAPKDQRLVADTLRDLAAEGTAVVTSGHDTHALLRVSDVVLWSVAGTTHHLGRPSDAVGHWQFRREYLGPNFTMDPSAGEERP